MTAAYSRPATLDDLKVLIRSLNEQGADEEAQDRTGGDEASEVRTLGHVRQVNPTTGPCSPQGKPLEDCLVTGIRPVRSRPVGDHVVETKGRRPTGHLLEDTDRRQRELR